VLPLLLLGAGALFFRQPQLVFENRLTDMVTVQVAGEERRILPGGSFTLKLDRGRRLDLAWQLVPRLGTALGDTIAIAGPRGTVHVRATARPAHGAYFAPVITNETGQPLAITVNAGWRARCAAAARYHRARCGWRSATTRCSRTPPCVPQPERRAATFQNLGSQVNATDGIVGLLFRPEDLRTAR